MDAGEENDARQHLAALPGFSPETAKAARFTRLFGLTNRVYRVDVGAISYVLRIPGSGSGAIIDRRVEQANLSRAAAAGVAPPVLHFTADGVMLTPFIEDAEPLTRERLRARPDAIGRVAAVLRLLHDKAAPFERNFEPFGIMDDYLSVLAALDAVPGASALSVINEAQAIRQALAARPVEHRPCHCDPTGRNLLDTGTRIWLVDWEYSGQNDPAWDLAYFSLESGLDAAGDRALLSAYHGRTPAPAEAARVEVMKPVCQTLAALWALIQAAQGNRVADFAGYADETLSLAAARIEAPGLAMHLEALRTG